MNELFDEEIISEINLMLNDMKKEIVGYEKEYGEYYDSKVKDIRDHVQKLSSILEDIEDKIVEIRRTIRIDN